MYEKRFCLILDEGSDPLTFDREWRWRAPASRAASPPCRHGGWSGSSGRDVIVVKPGHALSTHPPSWLDGRSGAVAVDRAAPRQSAAKCAGLARTQSGEPSDNRRHPGNHPASAPHRFSSRAGTLCCWCPSDLIAFLEFQRVDRSGGKPHRQTVTPFCNLHFDCGGAAIGPMHTIAAPTMREGRK